MSCFKVDLLCEEGWEIWSEKKREKVVHCFVAYCFAAAEKDVPIYSLLCLRYVSRLFWGEVTAEGMCERARRDGGEAWCMVYTVLRPSHSAATRQLMKAYQQLPSLPIMMLILLSGCSEDVLSNEVSDLVRPEDATVNKLVFKHLQGVYQGPEFVCFIVKLVLSHFQHWERIMPEVVSFIMKERMRHKTYSLGLGEFFMRLMDGDPHFSELVLLPLLRRLSKEIEYADRTTIDRLAPREDVQALLVRTVVTRRYEMARFLLEEGVSSDAPIVFQYLSFLVNA